MRETSFADKRRLSIVNVVNTSGTSAPAQDGMDYKHKPRTTPIFVDQNGIYKSFGDYLSNIMLWIY